MSAVDLPTGTTAQGTPVTVTIHGITASPGRRSMGIATDDAIINIAEKCNAVIAGGDRVGDEVTATITGEIAQYFGRDLYVGYGDDALLKVNVHSPAVQVQVR